jgi:hypothetical protein
VTGYEKFLINEFSKVDNTQFAEHVSLSLSAQVMGYGCEVVAKCCEEGNYVKSWVEDLSYKAVLQTPMSLPQSLPGCHAPFQNEELQKKLCDDCKKAVKIKAEEKKCNAFGDFELAGFPQKNAGKDNKKSGAKDLEKAQAKFLEVGQREQVGQKARELVSTHMSSEWVKKRCLDTAKKIKGKFSKIKGDLEKGPLCVCMGCCIPDIKADKKSDCPYPLVLDARR